MDTSPSSRPHVESITKPSPGQPSTALLPHRPPCNFLNTPRALQPHGLCTRWSLCSIALPSWHRLCLNIPFSTDPALQPYVEGECLPCQHLQSPCSAHFFFFSHGPTSRELYNVLMVSFQHMRLCLFFSICTPYQRVNSTRLRALCFVYRCIPKTQCLTQCNCLRNK